MCVCVPSSQIWLVELHQQVEQKAEMGHNPTLGQLAAILRPPFFKVEAGTVTSNHS